MGHPRNALSPLLPAIRSEFGLTFGQAGDLATAYFIAYAGVQLVGGYLMVLVAAGLAGLGALLVVAVRPAFRTGPEVPLRAPAPTFTRFGALV